MAGRLRAALAGRRMDRERFRPSARPEPGRALGIEPTAPLPRLRWAAPMGALALVGSGRRHALAVRAALTGAPMEVTGPARERWPCSHWVRLNDHYPAHLAVWRVDRDGHGPHRLVIHPPSRIGQPVDIRLTTTQRIVAIDQPLGWAIPVDPQPGLGQRPTKKALPSRRRSGPVCACRLGPNHPMASRVCARDFG